ANQRSGVDIRNTYEVAVFEIRLDRRICLVAAIIHAIVLANQSGNLDLPGLRLGIGNAIVADMGIGGYHDLTIIRGIGKNLLVARGAGVETDFTSGGADLAGRLTVENSSVFQ